MHIVNAQERGFSEFWKLRNGSGKCRRSSRNQQLASGEYCLALIPQGSPIRASPNTGQARPRAPPYPSFPCLVGQPELGTESARGCGVAGLGGASFRSCSHPIPPQELGTWLRKGTVGLNITWAGQPSRAGMEKLVTLSLAPTLAGFPVPASGCDLLWLVLDRALVALEILPSVSISCEYQASLTHSSGHYLVSGTKS